MTWLKFYYFTFLYHYRNKPDSWAGDFRSLLLVELSMCWLLLSLWIIADPGLNSSGASTKLLILIINVIILVILHMALMSKGKSEAIFQEYKDSAVNTSTNRGICWGIWAVSLIVFILTASLKQGL